MINIRIRNPAASMISGKVNQKEILSVNTISIHKRIYGTIELINCHTLCDIRGLLYFEMIDCHELVDGGDVYEVMILEFN